MKHVSLVLVCSLGTWVLVAFCVLMLGEWSRWGFMDPPNTPPWVMNLYVLFQLGIPTAAGLYVRARLAARWSRPESRMGTARSRLWAMRMAVTGYVLTAVFGVPAAFSALSAESLAPLLHGLPAAPHSYSRAYAGVPLAPGVVLVYHEYRLGMANGASGFYLYFWNGSSAYYVTSLQVWVS